MDGNPQSFWQFSEQLRLQTGNLANLSLKDSIWNTSFVMKRLEERRNFDVRTGGKVNSLNNFEAKVHDSDLNRFNDLNNGSDLSSTGNEKNALNVFDNGWNSFINPKGSDFNSFNDGWKLNSANVGVDPVIGGAQKGINGVFNKIGSCNTNSFVNVKNYKNCGKVEEEHGGKTGRRNVTRRIVVKIPMITRNLISMLWTRGSKPFPHLNLCPEMKQLVGHIFVCNNDTMQENLKRQLFGLPLRYRDSVKAITPGLPIFLYNYSTHQLHGIFGVCLLSIRFNYAASFGGTHTDPTAWEDKKTVSKSRFPLQVRIMTRKIYSFRPILHHYDGLKFRLELNIPEALSLLDIFEENSP